MIAHTDLRRPASGAHHQRIIAAHHDAHHPQVVDSIDPRGRIMMRASFRQNMMRKRPQVVDSIDRIMMRIIRIIAAHHQGPL